MYNIQSVYTTIKLLGISDTHFYEGLNKYSGLPHRLQKIGTFKHIIFYDDSASNNPASTVGALNTLSKVHTLIIGGQNRGFDFSSVIDALNSHGVSHVILFPDTDTIIRKLIHKKYNDTISIFKTDSMEQAVKYAYKITPKNNICLLSPGAPSYLMYDNFTQRGLDFVRLVEQYA